MTQAQLASTISLDQSSLTKIESGTRRVSALELSRIAGALGERIEWFVSEAPEAIVSHRNRLDPGAASPEIDRLIENAARNIEFLVSQDSQLELPEVPQLERPNNIDEAERSASEARALLGLGEADPLISASDRASCLGLLTFSFNLGSDAADAASILLARGAVVLVNGELHVGRRRLAFAHDLGHCLFADEYTVDWRVSEQDNSNAWEGRLDRFARALLLPHAGLETSWNELRDRGDDLRTAVVKLASTFRVDMATLARRLLELGHVDAVRASQVRTTRTNRADIVELNLLVHDELSSSTLPRIYEQSVLRLFRNEVVSSARATDLLFDLWDEEDLPDLPELPESAIWKFVS